MDRVQRSELRVLIQLRVVTQSKFTGRKSWAHRQAPVYNLSLFIEKLDRESHIGHDTLRRLR